MSSSKATFFRWPIVDFKKQRLEVKNKKEKLLSDVFALTKDSDTQFALFFYDQTGYWKDCIYGIVFKKIDGDKSVECDLKIWLENDEGKKFGEYSAQKQAFKKVDDQCKFNVKDTGNDWTLLKAIDDNHKVLFVCCELLDLNSHAVPIVDCKKDFLQNNWLMYEKGLHDAIIKIGDKELKIFKFPFMAQSSIFEQMFTSNFKEGVTSTINVKDVEENTMMHLIKWFYTSQIEDDALIEKLFAAADKYDVKLLKSTCVQLMTNSFDSVNAFSRLILAVQHNDQVLKEAALDFIANLPTIDYVKFLKSPGWIELNAKNVKTAQEVGDLLEEDLEE